MSVHKVLDVDIMDDEGVRRRIARTSLAMLAVGVVGGAALALACGWRPGGVWWWLALAGLYVACLPVHELVHGAFFKLFAPRGARVRFGYRSGMLYAGCPGARMGRGRFAVVLLAPFVLVTAACVFAGAALGAPLMAWSLGWLHGSGCAGDLYLAWLVARRPEADLCEDTEGGVALWSSGD